MTVSLRCAIVLFTGLFVVWSASPGFGLTRQEVVKRGSLRCGVATGAPGFSTVDESGRWTGFDVDFCRAVAAATVGDADLVTFVPLADRDSYTALLSGDVDLLSRREAWTFRRDAGLAVNFAGITFHGYTGLLVRRSLKAEKLEDLKSVKACQPLDTGDDELLFDFLRRAGIQYKKVPFDSSDLALKGFEAGTCEILAGERSQLAGLVVAGQSLQEKAVLLQDTVSRQPYGPVVRQGDDEWLDIVRWSLYAMINAEALGVSSRNIMEKRLTTDLEIQRLLGLGADNGRVLGLQKGWVVRIIEQVGNYGEVYERNFGSDTSLKLERGVNQLWKDGGLMYAPPF